MSTVNKHKAAASITTPPSNYTTLFFDENGNLYGKKSDGSTVRYSPAGDASGVEYTPDNSLLWTDSVDPGNVAEALDDLALRLNAAENDLATPPDASEVTYTPQTSLHWTDSEDPGQVDDALDDLAARLNALEEAGSGSGVADGDYGDITVSSAGSVFTINNDAVGNAKLANMATQTIKGRTTAGTGDPEDLTAAQAATIVQGDGLDADAAGFRGIPQNAQTGNYTTVAADAGKHIYHASGAGAGDTYTIAANASVAYEIGAAITFVNMATDSVSIAINSDTLRLAGAGTTGTRTLAQYGIATAVKIGSTEWLISGTNLT